MLYYTKKKKNLGRLIFFIHSLEYFGSEEKRKTSCSPFDEYIRLYTME